MCFADFRSTVTICGRKLVPAGVGPGGVFATVIVEIGSEQIGFVNRFFASAIKHRGGLRTLRPCTSSIGQFEKLTLIQQHVGMDAAFDIV